MLNIFYTQDKVIKKHNKTQGNMIEGIDIHNVLWALFGVIIIVLAIKAKSNYTKRTEQIAETQRQKENLEKESVEVQVSKFERESKEVNYKISSGQEHLKDLDKSVEKLELERLYIEVGLLPPVYRFDDREELKAQINKCFTDQYNLISKGLATDAYTKWEWFGCEKTGAKMVEDYRYLLLKAFNAEFDAIRKKMRHSTYETAVNKLHRVNEQLGKLSETANVTISAEFFNLKINELNAWHRELSHRERQKAERKKQQAILREQNQQSADETDDLEDEISYRSSDLKKAQTLALKLHGASAKVMQDKIYKMKAEIAKLENKFQRATSQAQITKAGYIYVISNLGSFGESIVKIGMTRRLEPMDRVNELGDASVPFKFDVHTMAFVQNAPEIEKKLHRKFDPKRVNVENNRKEFFKISPEEVKVAMDELKIQSDWFFDVEAKEFRESVLIREAMDKLEHDDTPNSLPVSI
ncbi:DUF4041 domain-containing protein [Pseudoalteromonas distincta]|uniref:DUF4041 domain-containing protein n=1 Tax=Pseudoalteromonas distincta TaxID=77608 RepID=A0A4P9J5P3_9GAMM|nr:DUF4041 domain-containing protein [Pseudoalteromonas distincta]QCU76360.1 DUF4041 domain-containing protein [Pseudoalteromonas distincta]